VAAVPPRPRWALGLGGPRRVLLARAPAPRRAALAGELRARRRPLRTLRPLGPRSLAHARAGRPQQQRSLRHVLDRPGDPQRERRAALARRRRAPSHARGAHAHDRGLPARREPHGGAEPERPVRAPRLPRRAPCRPSPGPSGRGPTELTAQAAVRPSLGASPRCWQIRMMRMRERPKRAAQPRGGEAKGIAHVLEGEGPARVASLDPLPRLRGELTALAPGPDLAYQAVDRVLEDGAHERALTGGRTRLGHPCVLRLLRHIHIKHFGISSFLVWVGCWPSLGKKPRGMT